MINKISCLLFTIILYYNVFLGKVFSLPIYKNYNNTDILITKLKLGSLVGMSESQHFNFKTTEKGLNVLFEFNPLFNIKYFNYFTLGFNVDYFTNKHFKTTATFINFGYNLPVIFSARKLFPNIMLYFNAGYGLKCILGNYDSSLVNYIGENTTISTLALGIELYPKYLKDYKLAFYLDYKNIYSYNKNVTNYIKNNEIYKYSFATIGLIYKTNFLIKSE